MIQDLAALPLPTSDLFQSVLQDADLVDESELDQWDQGPPYTVPSDQYFSPVYIDNLVDVMHGRQLREHRREQSKRVETARSIDVGKETYGVFMNSRELV